MNYKIFKNISPNPIIVGKRASVMVLIEKGNRIEEDRYKVDFNDFIVFEKRSLKLKSQPGDICFPGGRIELGEDPKDTAIRETIEELGINKEKLEVVAPLDYLITPNRNIIYPYLGIYNDNSYRIEESEVSNIVKVTIKDILDQVPEIFNTSIKQFPQDDFPFHRINGGKAYPFMDGVNPQVFYYLGEDTLWGTTAIILKNFLEKLFTGK